MLAYSWLVQGPLNYSALVIMSLVWIIAFFLVGTATVEKKSAK